MSEQKPQEVIIAALKKHGCGVEKLDPDELENLLNFLNSTYVSGYQRGLEAANEITRDIVDGLEAARSAPNGGH